MHTHACPDTLIERSRFPCVHTYLQKETKARLHSTKTWKSASSSIGGGARLFSFVAFALAPPLLRFSHSRKREREEDDDDVFPLFLHRASSCAKVVSSCAIDRTTRVVEVISTDVFFFLSRETTKGPRKTRSAVGARASARAQTSDDDGGRNV